MTKVTIAGVLMAASFILILTPKTKLTCLLLLSFICALFVVLWQSFTYSLRGVKRKLIAFGRKLIYTTGREWILDEQEEAITE